MKALSVEQANHVSGGIAPLAVVAAVKVGKVLGGATVAAAGAAGFHYGRKAVRNLQK